MTKTVMTYGTKATLLIAFMMTGGALAQEATEGNTSTLKNSEAGIQSKPAKDIDDEITNAKLRASTGAKRKVSISSSFSYSGGSLTNPTSTERPQLNDNSTSADPTKLIGQIAVKFRASEHDNISLGFGVDYTPAYRSRTTNEPARTGASTPYLDYSRVFKAMDLQNIFSVGVSKYTAKEDVDDSKLNASAYVSHTLMGPIGDTKFEVGLYGAVGQEIYSEYNPNGALYSFTINPMLEYAFTDKTSFRTVYRAYTATSGVDERNTYKISDTTQSMGVGYAVTRDIYLYPNMQWKWGKISADKTTVGLSANINL